MITPRSIMILSRRSKKDISQHVQKLCFQLQVKASPMIWAYLIEWLRRYDYLMLVIGLTASKEECADLTATTISTAMELLVLSAWYGNARHDQCPRSFNCGALGRLRFPFTKPELPNCGLMVVHNCDDSNPSSNKMIELKKNGTPFLQLNGVFLQQNGITVFDQDLHDRLESNGSCEAFNNNISIPARSPLISFDIRYNTTLFKCNHKLNVSTPSGFIKNSCAGFDIYHYSVLSDLSPHQKSLFSACLTLVLPKKDLPDSSDLQSFLSAQMTLEVRISDACDKCYNDEGGWCQLDSNKYFYCNAVRERRSKILKVVLASAFSIGVIMLLILAYCFKRKFFHATFCLSWARNHPTQQIIEDFLKQHRTSFSKIYSYSEIKKMTSNFKIKLGQGGYGIVYKGSLLDGQLVAVKVLSELKGTGEEFINEVASISRTSHVNIVTLLGFCFEGSNKILVYEFMANGSLEKFIFQNEANLHDGNLQLSCEILHKIAVGVARGLEYLHRGCNTRILHFDIKPHNILLDENFCPKISDFGLAKICPGNESIVSMLGARGTIGYIAPEVIYRNFGAVSQKSDVYSFGMMVLEMVGGRSNVNVKVDKTSEIYFPHWIYKRLELNQDLALQSLRDEGDKEIIRWMVITSLWCIQTNPSDRPIMSKVVEMLEGRVEIVQLPPKPYLSSPSRSPYPSSSSTP
ncbi:LEAF RUST 10 DISEASE-RESISTANCE LOCUS RECEPTOR-LIKE PROTEIN KINASE-like 2.1 [Prosopis cineraria]|uniref:LEAF RUST 10 DISEASE-RESISTANCE LOCUS RECEPTOR-LIKE PROTEIN KINASE-like 2.1 n=1 Tax=Prosopis cineraria TaxID=364024 RepID=UPI002410B562|nr:LEAF RUST 10 DISEASE-RESISTANCE LOCUS RECEPTOR-LIKE PROTEIN KINASE-like 2.1 [Prosopis cineraria]